MIEAPDLRPELRQANLADLADVMTVMADAFDPRFGEAWTEQQCAGIVAMPGSWLVVARLNAAPVGFALSRAIGSDGELLLIGVRPHVRGRGIGAALLDRVVADARALGVRSFHLEVREGNDAVALYQRHGFDRVGRRPGYYRGSDGSVHDALTFKALLAINSS